MKFSKQKFLKLSKKIKNMKEALSDAKKFNSELPDGLFKGRISGADIVTSKNSGDLQIIVNLMVVDHEEYEGLKAVSFMGIEGDRLSWTLGTLIRLGFEIEGDVEDIYTAVEELNSSNMIVSFEQKNGFANIKKNLNEEIEEDEDDSESIMSEDDGDVEERDEDAEEEDEETEEEEDDEDESLEISEGDLVSWSNKKGKTLTGEVIEILEDDNSARVETAEGKILTIEYDKLSLLDEEPEEIEDEEEEIEEEEEELEPDEEDEVVDDEEEEEEQPKTKKKGEKKPVKKAKESKVSKVTKVEKTTVKKHVKKPVKKVVKKAVKNLLKENKPNL